MHAVAELNAVAVLLHLSILWTSLGLAVLVWLHCVKYKVWWRWMYGVGLFFFSGPGPVPLVPVKGILNALT